MYYKLSISKYIVPMLTFSEHIVTLSTLVVFVELSSMSPKYTFMICLEQI